MDNFRKSSHSHVYGNCVEVASGVTVRDTADRDGVTLMFSGVSWGKFISSLR
jgi:hypothetical protein